MTVKELNEIENRLDGYKNYGDIPVKFINEVERKFSEYAFLKSLLDMKKEESRY